MLISMHQKLLQQKSSVESDYAKVGLENRRIPTLLTPTANPIIIKPARDHDIFSFLHFRYRAPLPHRTLGIGYEHTV